MNDTLLISLGNDRNVRVKRYKDKEKTKNKIFSKIPIQIPKKNKLYLWVCPFAFSNLAKQYPKNGINDHKKTITTEKNIDEIEILIWNNLLNNA